MKILCLTNGFPPQIGGVASHVDEITRHMAAFGHQINILTPAKDSDRTEVCPQGRIIHRRKWRLQKFRNLKLALWLHRQTGLEKPDVLHVHDLKALTATNFGSVPVVFTNHTEHFLRRIQHSTLSKMRLRRWVSHVSAFIAPSRERVEEAYEVGYTGPGYYVPNAVDIKKFSADPITRQRLRTELNVREDESVILLSARLDKMKGVADFAHACGTLSGLQYKILVAGTGPERPVMERIFSELGIADRVLWGGG